MLKFILLFLGLVTNLSAYQYDLSICMIFRNEAPYLKEWIDFHREVGVQHFYLINHLSTDDYAEVLLPYISMGIVELFDEKADSPNPGDFFVLQEANYNKIREYSKKQTKWLALIDSDEFLFPVYQKNLRKFLKNYEDNQIAAIYVFWQCYGTSYVESIPQNKKMIECLLYKAEEQYPANKYGKTILRPDRCKRSMIHMTHPKPGFTCVLPNKVQIKPALFQNPDSVNALTVDISSIRINHYWTRDEKYYREFKVPRYQEWGDASGGGCYERYKDLNKVYDPAILKYIE